MYFPDINVFLGQSCRPEFLNRRAAARYRALASIIPGPGINYIGPWHQLYRALASIIPGPDINYTGPWHQLYRALTSIIPGSNINYTGPWHQLYRALTSIIPGPDINYTRPRDVLLELTINLNAILYLSTYQTVHINVLILFMIML